jgi:hypothetical protein
MTPRELLTLADVQAVPHATPKHRLPTKLDRAIASRAARLLDQKLLREWALKVKHRDQWKDRKTGQRLRRCLELDPLRAEAHHLEPRSTIATRYDIRNGITLSYEHHAKVERGDYRIEGTAFFRGSDGGRYIDGTFPVVFVRV